MWVVRNTNWRNGNQYVQAQKSFETYEEAQKFREKQAVSTEIYETNQSVEDFGTF
ncbi:hypothetical protein SAMN02910293_02131 [Streptococcus henryi]|jgi:hypothetical protein|uniref:Uncharacterized protein n=1 Tax=Streptococcus henryi TaxID=439219 RepID=A0A1G6DD72_9STRE|nr:hypothetical protein [Streptococcus henryi]SDB43114.1 hypothetical protein SAMN02910293_02131 [Streptococcus henryi]